MNEDQDCALRRLHQLLDHANSTGTLASTASQVLQSAMSGIGDSLGMLDFFYILRQAYVEACLITTPSSAAEYIPALAEFHEYVLAHDARQVNWSEYSGYINNFRVILVVDALAYYYSQQHPSRSLEDDFLNGLTEQLNAILREVSESDLPIGLKKVIASSLNGVLQSVYKYRIDGTAGVKRAVQALIAELVILDSAEDKAARTSKTYRRVSTFAAFLLTLLRPSLYDVIGAVPDIQTFWLPAIQQLHEATSDQVDKFPSLQELLKIAEKTLRNSQPNSLPAAAQPKAYLPPSKD
jgi:hypothetical protein